MKWHILLALFVVTSSAISLDDAGLDEALRAHVGPAMTVAALNTKSLLVATSAGALAGMNARTGVVQWRAVLPTGALSSLYI